MSEMTSKNKRRYNALDVTVILLVILLLLGAVGRIMLDRRKGKAHEERILSFTCQVPAFEEENLAQGSVLYTEKGDVFGSVVKIDASQAVSESMGSVTDRYVRITGSILVKGYVSKDGVFYTSNGESLRINTSISLKNGEDIRIYINDIVENGQ